MTQEFLSQDEVDALLEGVTDAPDETSENIPSAEGSVKAYDLGRQERIIRGHMPALELINERFIRYLRIGLFNYMHKDVEVSVGPVRVQKYSEFIRNLVVPTSFNLIQAKPLRGTGLIVLDPNLVFLVVDNLFGGDGRFHTRVEGEGRDFTTTEQRIIQGLLCVVFEEYQKAWQPVFPLKFEYVRSEINTQFVNIATPSEVVIALTVTLEFSGNTSEMHVCLPYLMMEPIRDILYGAPDSAPTSADKRWTSMLARQLQTAEVELTAALGTTSITLGKILKMQVGDVIPLNIEEKVQATISGIPVIEARYGIQNGQLALKIERFLAEEET
jgi:flagellar motor switch protein FliM